MTSARRRNQALDKTDGGKSSRKFLLTVVTMIILCLMVVLGLFHPTVIPLFPTFVGGLLGVLGLYFSGNVANKAIIGNNIARLNEQEGEEYGMD